MIPVGDDIRTHSAPGAVLALIGANVAIFFAVLSLGPGEGAALLERWGLVPREFLRGAAQYGATEHLVWVTPVSAMFLHGGLLHLAGNMLYLWIFGTAIEDLLGVRRFLVLYAACGLAAAAIHVASDPTSFVPSVGASGAVSGLLGAYAVSYPTGRLRLLWPRVPVPAFLFLLVWIALQLVAGLSARDGGGSGTAWWAHVGGFAAGAALARAMWIRRPTRSRLRI
jgi:membrane associated rhomboid family serine protease